jgi:hypothetical protein
MQLLPISPFFVTINKAHSGDSYEKNLKEFFRQPHPTKQDSPPPHPDRIGGQFAQFICCLRL